MKKTLEHPDLFAEPVSSVNVDALLDFSDRAEHMCHCGVWGSFGAANYDLAARTYTGRIWFCRAHWPETMRSLMEGL